MTSLDTAREAQEVAEGTATTLRVELTAKDKALATFECNAETAARQIEELKAEVANLKRDEDIFRAAFLLRGKD